MARLSMRARRVAAALVVFLAGCHGRRHDGPKAGPSASAAASAALPSASVFAEGLPMAPPAPLAPSTFADLAARADPAVVFIETEQAMFGRGKRIVAGGVGTGFVFDASGLILTNDHVVANATRIDAV